MPFNSSSYDVYFQVTYKVKEVSYTDYFPWSSYSGYEGYPYGSVYYTQSNKRNDNLYEGNTQITRSFSPPVHTPLFDPREGKGISIHHQVGSLGYYRMVNFTEDRGNFDGLTPSNVSLSQIYGNLNNSSYPIVSVNSPKLYVGVRRTGTPKWFYIPARYSLKIKDVYTNNINESVYGSSTKYKTAVYVSGGDGLVDFNPMRIQVIPERNDLNRVLQLHVSYMPNNVYYLFSSNENTNRMFSFFNNYEIGRLWIAHESYGTH